MIKTITIDGNTSVKIKQSPHDMDRFCCVENHSEADMFASCTDSQCTENADGVARISAGGYKIIDTESYETLYIRGSGEVELTTSAYIGALARSFKHASKGGDAKSISGESSYTLTDAADYPMLGLNLYGKSVQDGTPSPDNPVDIFSVGDGGFDIVSDGGNEFAVISCRNNSGDIITSHPVSVAVMDGDAAAFTITATGTGLTYLWQYSTDGGAAWKNTSNKTTSYKITVKQIYDGYQYRCIVTDENGNSETSNVAALYIVSDDCTVKTGSIVLPDVLCGIPVSEGGNYTDSNGQQWVCDELIYNADGTGKIIKRCNKIRLESSNITGFVEHTTIGNYFYTNVKSINIDEQSSLIPISNAFEGVKFSERAQLDYFNIFRCFISTDGRILLRNSVAENDKFTTLESMQNFVDSNDVYVIYPLDEPQEIELTSADVDALRTLQTFDGVTNIYNNGDAEMSVKYCTNNAFSDCVLPLVSGLQKQIDELQAAILSLGSNV